MTHLIAVDKEQDVSMGIGVNRREKNMKFRIIYTYKSKTFETKWLDCQKYTIKKMRRIEKALNKDKRVENWYLEYNRN